MIGTADASTSAGGDLLHPLTFERDHTDNTAEGSTTDGVLPPLPILVQQGPSAIDELSTDLVASTNFNSRYLDLLLRFDGADDAE